MGLSLPTTGPQTVATAESPAIGRLEAARRAVERRFLEAGEVLAQAVEGVGLLIGSLDNLVGALDPATVEATTGELKDAAASLLALPERHLGRRQVIERLKSKGGTLSASIDEMRRDLAYLRVFAINIKITAGGIPAAGDEFDVFAQEICDRIELGRQQLNALEADLAALCTELAAALGQEQALAQYCEGLLPAIPDGLKASAQDIEAHHDRVSKAAAEVAQLARHVQKKVGSALAALQIGDITRQRIEHVQQALNLTAAMDGLDAEARERVDAVMSGLAAAQLQAAAADFHGDVARIGQNMSGIAADASQILRLRDVAFGRNKDGGEGFLKRMEGHVGRALDLVDRLAKADMAAIDVGHSAAASAGLLGERIVSLQGIKNDVHHMALNTTLKCGRIGESGKPLAVIAVEMRTHASYMETSAQDALNVLGEVAPEADALSKHDVGAGDGTAGAALAGAADRLRTAGDTVEADLIQLVRQGEAVVESLNRAAARLDLQREIGAILDETASALTLVSGRPAVGDLADRLTPLLDRIGKSYTMASEREAHRAFTQSLDLGVAVAAPTAAEPDADADLDDVLF